MTRKKMKLLVNSAYANREFNEKQMSKIVNALNRRELKLFIKLLKTQINKSTVYVTVPSKENQQILKDLEKIFPNKYVIIHEDKSLIAGVKVTDYDMVYNLNLNSTLEKMATITQ